MGCIIKNIRPALWVASNVGSWNRPISSANLDRQSQNSAQFKMLSLLFAVFCLKEWREVGKIVENAGASKGVGRALANRR